MQVEQHLLLEVVLSIIDRDAVIVPVQPVDQSRNRRFVQVAQVGGGLARLLSEHERLRVDEPKAVDDDFALDRLDRVDHDAHRPRVELLERLLRVNIRPRKPAVLCRLV